MSVFVVKVFRNGGACSARPSSSLRPQTGVQTGARGRLSIVPWLRHVNLCAVSSQVPRGLTVRLAAAVAEPDVTGSLILYWHARRERRNGCVQSTIMHTQIGCWGCVLCCQEDFLFYVDHQVSAKAP